MKSNVSTCVGNPNLTKETFMLIYPWSSLSRSHYPNGGTFVLFLKNNIYGNPSHVRVIMLSTKDNLIFINRVPSNCLSA